MSRGTTWQDRTLAIWREIKAAPSPGQLYPPQPQRGGGALPISWQGWPDRGGTGAGLTPLHSSRQGEQDLKNVKQAIASPWVFRDVTAIANEVSAAQLKVKRRVEEEGLEDIENHPFEQRWAKPNLFMGRSFVMRFWTFSMLLTGKGYLFLRPVNGHLAEIWPVPPWHIHPIPHREQFIAGYAYDQGDDKPPLTIEAKYIVYSRLPNIFDVRDGMSALVAGNTDIAGDLAASRWNANFFSKENATPSGLITVPRDTLDADLEVIRAQIIDFFGNATRRVGVARAGDMDWQPFDRSQKDMEFSTGRAFTEGLVDTLFGVPKGYWSDKANRANAEAARTVLIENTAWPLLVGLHEDLNAQAAPHWLADDDEVIEFSDIRPSNTERETAEYNLRKDISTVNELRRVQGLPPLPDYRGLMLLSELKKGAPLPATIPAMAAEDAAAEMDEPDAEGVMPADEGDGATPGEEGAAPPPEEEPVEALAEQPEADAELKRWERKALKALRRTGRAAVTFASAAIPAAEAARIAAALAGAGDAAAVRAAFKAAPARVAPDAVVVDDDLLARAAALRSEVEEG